MRKARIGRRKLLLGLSTFACGCSGATRARPIETARAQTPAYFDKGVFGQNERGDRRMQDWFSSALTVMREPSLLKAGTGTGSAQGYRFLWLRFKHPAIGVRIARTEKNVHLRAALLTGSAGDPGVIDRVIERDDVSWDSTAEAIERTNFWQLPTLDDANDGFDGAGWLLEGYRNDKWHAVLRWSPDVGPFRDACLRLVQLAGFKLVPDEIY